MLVFDVDGTLLADNHTVLPETLAQIKRLEDKGHAVVVATGRSYPQAINIAKLVGVKTRLVANNGALTYDFNDDKFIVHGTLTRKIIDYVCQQAQKLGREFGWSHGLKNYSVYFGTTPSRDISDPQFFIAGVVRKVYDEWEQVKQTLEDPSQVYQVTIKGERKLIEQMVQVFKKDLDGLCEVAETSGVYIDVNAKGINKWHAVQQIQNILGIPNDLTYAFGDSFNDLLMLQNVGTGVAMGNAKEPIKQAARHVIGNNNEPSIANFLAQLE